MAFADCESAAPDRRTDRRPVVRRRRHTAAAAAAAAAIAAACTWGDCRIAVAVGGGGAGAEAAAVRIAAEAVAVCDESSVRYDNRTVRNTIFFHIFPADKTVKKNIAAPILDPKRSHKFFVEKM